MPQGKSETTGLLILGAVALFFILRQRGALAAGNGGAGGLDLSMTGPGPEPVTINPPPATQPFQPSFRPGGGVIPFERQPLLGNQIVEGAITAFTQPGAGMGVQLIRPQPKSTPGMITSAELEARRRRGEFTIPLGTVVQARPRTGAEQFGEAIQNFFGGLFR